MAYGEREQRITAQEVQRAFFMCKWNMSISGNASFYSTVLTVYLPRK